MLTVEEAQSVVLREAQPKGVEWVSTLECVGRVLAENIAAPHDLPPFENAAMDGYALCSEGTLHAPVRLQVGGEILAGMTDFSQPAEAEAVAITTGAPLPGWADAVVPIEDVIVEEGSIRIDLPVLPGANVRPRGLDVRAETIVLPAGTRLQVTHLGLLSGLGITSLPVFCRPRVALLVTGSELVPLSEPLQPGKIRDTNSIQLISLLAAYGITCDFLGIVSDEIDALLNKLREAYERADVILLTGGVSVGSRDLAKPALEKLGARTLFWRVKMKPGKPLLVARWGDRILFGLPGNPLAGVVGLLVFVLPFIAAVERGAPLSCWVSARLRVPLKKEEERAEFQTSKLRLTNDGQLEVEPTPAQGSSLLNSFAQANAFIFLPAGKGEFAPGTMVSVIPIRGGCAWNG